MLPEAPPGSPLAELLKIYRSFLYLPPESVVPNVELVIRFPFSCLLGFKLESETPWGLIIGPPSTLKSEVILSMRGLKSDIIQGGKLSDKAMVSGYLGEEKKQRKKLESGKDPSPYSFATELRNKILAIDDWTQLTSDPKRVQGLLSDLRMLYSGYLAHRTGVQTTPAEYELRFGIIAGVTPAIDMIRAQEALLGERFIAIRIETGDTRQATKTAIRNALTKNYGWKKVLMEKVTCWMVKHFPNKLGPVTCSDEIEDKCSYLAELTSWLRTPLPKRRVGGGEVIQEGRGETEKGPRVGGQLIIVAAGHALLNGRDRITHEDLSIATMSARGAIRAVPFDIVKSLFEKGRLKTADIAYFLGNAYNHSTISYNIQELCRVRKNNSSIAISNRQAGDTIYELSPEFIEYTLESGFFERFKLHESTYTGGKVISLPSLIKEQKHDKGGKDSSGGSPKRPAQIG